MPIGAKVMTVWCVRVHRTRQAERVAQARALVLAAQEAAPLQLRKHPIDAKAMTRSRAPVRWTRRHHTRKRRPPSGVAIGA